MQRPVRAMPADARGGIEYVVARNALLAQGTGRGIEQTIFARRMHRTELCASPQ